MKTLSASALFAGAAALLLFGVIVWSIGRPHRMFAPPPVFAGSTFAFGSSEDVVPVPADWEEPVSQSAGPDWIFEVFTPPVIYFNPESATFTVTPPLPRGSPPTFPLELIEVKWDLYRLQYAGHLGEEGRYLIELLNQETGTYLRGRVGEAFEEEGFTIKAFSVETRFVRLEDPEHTPYAESAVRLLLRDHRAEKEVELTRQPLRDEQPAAVLRSADGGLHRLFPGESLTVGDDVFTLVSIDPLSGTARLRKQRHSDELEERITLQLLPSF